MVDGVEYHFNNAGTTLSAALLFELTGLEDKRHNVTIRTNIEGKQVSLDAFDVNEGGHISYAVGYVIPEQEESWRRYDDTHPGFTYQGVWQTDSNAAYYGGARKSQPNSVIGNKIDFSFVGTKLRVITSMYFQYSDKIAITIDGVTEYYSLVGNGTSNGNNQFLAYEKTGLPHGTHTVSVEKINAGAYSVDHVWDAVDIDVNGYLVTPQNKPKTGGKLRTRVQEMEIGDYIRCGYSASSGTAGVFYGLGTDTDDAEISLDGPIAPNGYFYFIKVKEGLLVADRVIQTGISWLTLNMTSYTHGAQLNDSMIPLMVADTIPMLNVAPNGIPSASSVYSTTYSPWKAFDAVDGSYGWIGVNGQKQVWLEYAFQTPTVVKKYYLKAPNTSATMPSKWSFEGWDGNHWVKLDEQGQGGWLALEERSYNLDNIKAHLRYRIVIEQNDGHANYSGIGELRMSSERLVTKVRMLTGAIAYLRFDGHPTTTDEGLGLFPPENEWDTFIKNGQWGLKVWNNIDNSTSAEWTQDTVFSGFTNPPAGFTNNGTGRTVRGRNGSVTEYWSAVANYTGPSKIGFRPALEYVIV
ncbi:hypothetical protein GRF59_05515 [Paenibacillus sp. HJL G12]|uniref:F5/8 type C domain-containing protein n=1 Tax=Paenibacillus dendrobii TaxID=2691084 RepID=A0A7X3IJC0_9BACL|nr:discoidin domain-containing protein [Paenibacillus dendrobii]MWV43082.1 hypothetical protein [Paenibacillus dendrobii]